MAHSFANVMCLSICILGNRSCFKFSSNDFLQNYFFYKKKHPGPLSECQTVWIQIKTDIMLVFSWVQTVCKRLLADDKVFRWYAKSYNSGQYIVSYR